MDLSLNIKKAAGVTAVCVLAIAAGTGANAKVTLRWLQGNVQANYVKAVEMA